MHYKNTPYQSYLSTHPILSTHPLNSPSLSIHLINPQVRERAYRLLSPPAAIKGAGQHKGQGPGPGSVASGGAARGQPSTLLADEDESPEGGLFAGGGVSTCVHPSMAVTMQRLATLRYVQGDMTGAKALFEGTITPPPPHHHHYPPTTTTPLPL